jgi:hypothetical protein
VTNEQIGQFQKLAGQLDKLKESHKLDDEAKKWTDKLAGPAEKYREMLATLNKIHDAHKLNDADFAAGVKKLDQELGEGLKKDGAKSQDQLAPFIRTGSADAFRQQFGGGSQDKAAQDRKEQIELAKKH